MAVLNIQHQVVRVTPSNAHFALADVGPDWKRPVGLPDATHIVLVHHCASEIRHRFVPAVQRENAASARDPGQPHCPQLIWP